ncbi:E3 ubiquitin-protein ligase RNF12-like [Dendrobium catenatum]|uniref:E3 ubiquitin-protein ligase SDIR1 n=1 Tax=Dendrobium catenatum TaxID=906689 RepID=A0A2I0WX20_9ASPA|nr:E3 ubiquitin-protein ligase RNF12-like [Dendrobium catenatum]PKU80206.1 E3 ubiquitin-protein ligase SDIR1 [Dendrobium catenatum]
MASAISLSDDIHIFYNKIFQISSPDDDVEEPYLILSFVYNVDGDRMEHDIIATSEHNFTECNPSFLRTLIEEKEPLPLDEMIDPQDAEISREGISNILALLVDDCARVEGLKILEVNVIVDISLEEEDYVFMGLDDAEFLHERRMNSLQKNVYKKLAMAEKENEICAICLQEMKVGEEVACTPCVHRFHHTCISRWFEKSGFCPLCRFKIDPS